jgi:4a-hydroxytetrahydrobiopterin dehydratase
MKALTKRQIATHLKSLHDDWELSKTGTAISRKFAFRSYMAGFMFVTKVSVRAEVANHHPEVLLSYGSVKITFTTKDVKALTTADFELATTIDTLYDLSTKRVKGPHNHY